MSDLSKVFQEIRDRDAAATKGPWDNIQFMCDDDLLINGQVHTMNWQNDKDFIAHARTDVPLLLELLEFTYKQAKELYEMQNTTKYFDLAIQSILDKYDKN